MICDIIGKQIPLACPCGDPLQLFQVRVGDELRWCIGHPNKACSPLIHSPSLEKMINTLMGQLILYGHYPTAADFVGSKR